MKSTRRLLLHFLALFVFAATGLADTAIDLQPNDTVQTVLKSQIGQPVELRMKSGEKLGGKLVKVNEKVAHLTQLTGAEYFDAVVEIDDISAVVVRAKTK